MAEQHRPGANQAERPHGGWGAPGRPPPRCRRAPGRISRARWSSRRRIGRASTCSARRLMISMPVELPCGRCGRSFVPRTPSGAPALGFISIAVLTLASAVAAMSLRSLVHCALMLMVTFAGLAAFYLQLGAQFVGFAQILIYIGAVAILIVFAILLTRSDGAPGSLRFFLRWSGRCRNSGNRVRLVELVDPVERGSEARDSPSSDSNRPPDWRPVDDQVHLASRGNRPAADRCLDRGCDHLHASEGS